MLVHVSKDKDMKDFQHNFANTCIFIYSTSKDNKQDEIQLVNINFEPHVKYV